MKGWPRKDTSPKNIVQKLGNSYYFNGELDKAAKWYDELFAMAPNQQPEYLYRYAQSLKAVGQTDKANQMMEQFNQKAGNDNRASLYGKNKNYLDVIKANSGRYTIEDAGINSKYSDYGSAFFLNKLAFTSSRDTGNFMERKHKWTNQHFTNLYVSDLGEEMNPGKVDKFSKKVKSRFHESSAVFSKDGKTMYFTRNNFLDGKKGKSGEKITLIKIYKASFENEDWDKITELPFNSDSYSVAHPALSPDGKTLYFVSDMARKHRRIRHIQGESKRGRQFWNTGESRKGNQYRRKKKPSRFLPMKTNFILPRTGIPDWVVWTFSCPK